MAMGLQGDNAGQGGMNRLRVCRQVAYMVLACACMAEGKTEAPAPAPAGPGFENVTQSLVYGGEYGTFIELMEETQVDEIYQSIANETRGAGITIFAPTDKAFQVKLVASLLKNLTASQKKSLVEYHALNVYQAFKNLQNSHNNVTPTFATTNFGGGRYQVNLTFTGGGRLQIASGWTTAKISTTIYSEYPVSIFAIDQVLLPDEIFGLPPPPPPPSHLPSTHAPSPSPSSSPPTLRSPSSNDSRASSPIFRIHFLSPIFLSIFLFTLVNK